MIILFGFAMEEMKKPLTRVATLCKCSFIDCGTLLPLCVPPPYDGSFTDEEGFLLLLGRKTYLQLYLRIFRKWRESREKLFCILDPMVVLDDAFLALTQGWVRFIYLDSSHIEGSSLVHFLPHDPIPLLRRSCRKLADETIEEGQIILNYNLYSLMLKDRQGVYT